MILVSHVVVTELPFLSLSLIHIAGRLCGVTKPISPIPLFSSFFRINKIQRIY